MTAKRAQVVSVAEQAKITIQDVSEQNSLSYTTINECFKRWQQIPGPTAERRYKQSEFALRRKELERQFGELLEAFRAPITDQLQAAQAELEALQKTVTPQTQASLKPELDKKRAEINALATERNESNSKWLRQEATADVLRIRDDVDQLLTDVGEYDKSIAQGLVVTERAKAQIEQDVKDFDEANKYHVEQATGSLKALVVFAVLSAVATVGVFLWLPVSGSAASGTAATVEKAVLTGVGRIALLLFLGWTIRYLGGLHRSHSEQAVLYRDRKAALGVAKILLQSSERVEHKQEVLQTMTRTYIDFERNAFRAVAPQASRSDDVSLDKLKQLVEAARPIFEAAKGVVDKAK
jgi:hypothetical protein